MPKLTTREKAERKRKRNEQKALVARGKFLRELLDEFGARLSGFDPGVSANIKGKDFRCVGAPGAGYWGEHLSFNAIQWEWLEPLLLELRAYREKGKSKS